MSSIRVTYSGLISFGATIVSAVFRYSFLIIITRILSQEDYGSWGLITSLFFYGFIASSFISFWTIRDVARGKSVGSTSLISSGLFSILGVIIYVVVILAIQPQLSIGLDVLLITAILIPINFIHKAIGSINAGWKPELVSYGAMIGGGVSISLGLFFVYFLNWSIIGIVFSLAIAMSINIIFQLVCARDKIKNKFDLHIFKRWFKFSWIPTYPGIANLLYTTDIAIFMIITGSVIGISYYSAALILAGTVAFALGVSNSLYPKLLSGDKGKVVSRNITYFSFFIILLSFLIITFAKPGIFILNPVYEIASVVVIFLVMRVMFHSLSELLERLLMGIENVDNEEKSTVKNYIRSNLFFLPTLRLIQNIAYLIVLSIVLLLFNNSASDIELVIFWSIIAMSSQIPLLLYLSYKIKQTLQINLEIKSISKYIISGLISFLSIYLLTEKFIVYNKSLIEFIPQVLIFISLGIGMYIVISIIIDNTIRNLIKLVILEIIIIIKSFLK
jgi:O-antigen/teichoic acid export membrane protein